MRALAALGALAILAGCGPAPVEPADAPEPEAAPEEPAAFEGDFNAIGTEPFWALDIREGALVWNRMGEETRTLAADGPLISEDGARWISDEVAVTLTQAECSDGMSDRNYAYTAVVEVGAEILRGCATRPETDLGPAP